MFGSVATVSTHSRFVDEHTEPPGQVPHVWPLTTPHTAFACVHASAWHCPVVGSHRWPEPQVTPVQSDSQVLLALQRWPAAHVAHWSVPPHPSGIAPHAPLQVFGVHVGPGELGMQACASRLTMPVMLQR